MWVCLDYSWNGIIVVEALPWEKINLDIQNRVGNQAWTQMCPQADGYSVPVQFMQENNTTKLRLALYKKHPVMVLVFVTQLLSLNHQVVNNGSHAAD
jgi:hypothetical protein